MADFVGTHQVGGAKVVVKRKPCAVEEYTVQASADEFEVFLGDPSEGLKPDRWYTQIGGDFEGPFDTAEALVRTVFLDPDYA